MNSAGCRKVVGAFICDEVQNNIAEVETFFAQIQLFDVKASTRPK
jgi:hypothetical protein